METTVGIEIESQIAHLRLDDGKANGINGRLLADLDAALDAAERDARAVVLEGREGIFCAGLDLKTLSSLDPPDLRHVLNEFTRVFLRLFELPLPVVAACRGHAIAGGCVLLLTADERFAAEGDYKLGLNETALGITLPTFVAEMAKIQLPANVLQPVVVAGGLFTPKEAKELSLVQQVLPSLEVVDAARQRARELASLPAEAYRNNKRHLRGAAARAGRVAFESELEQFTGALRRS